MKPIVKYISMGAAGLVLFTGAFVMFAKMSGAPMHEIPLLGHLFPAPSETSDAIASVGAVEHAVEHAAGPEAPAKDAPKSDARALEANIGVLGSFLLPSPFSTSELSDLQRELRTALTDAKQRLVKIQERESRLDEWEHSLEGRVAELQEMRGLLEKHELELALREEEQKRDETAKSARDTQSWKELGKFFEDGDPEELAKKLAQFDPKEAVKILRSLDDERASQIVNALPADKYHVYLEAYRAQQK